MAIMRSFVCKPGQLPLGWAARGITPSFATFHFFIVSSNARPATLNRWLISVSSCNH